LLDKKEQPGVDTLRYESGLEHHGALLTAEANLAKLISTQPGKRAVETCPKAANQRDGQKRIYPMSVRRISRLLIQRRIADLEALAKNNPSLLQIIAQKNAAELDLSPLTLFFSTLSGSAGANKNGSHWYLRVINGTSAYFIYAHI